MWRVARCTRFKVRTLPRTAGAVRCHRDTDGTRDVDKKSLSICAHHNKEPWQLFVKDGWVYAVDLNAPELTKKKKKKKTKKRG